MYYSSNSTHRNDQTKNFQKTLPVWITNGQLFLLYFLLESEKNLQDPPTTILGIS